ncbi:hypothetical protein BDV95DRAFT_174474 [Massariosphaeria phaeospora]|uniref:Uncharacterized protein n=1 Tax=Massariosphaeria phaeospora TaxID=100035 RepID=A0A7C8I4E1_9PLEO|nr:hypothetical protein BDV95DRAFT_174474 [Massariosphaeria phaeospora]
MPPIPAAPSAIGPSKLQIALAVAIVRSKPRGVSARDYVLQLRDHLKKGRLDHDEEDHRRYLDMMAYWRKRCEQFEQTSNDLERRNSQLERANQVLQGRLGLDNWVEGGATAPKRKSQEPTPARRSKRSKPSPQTPEPSTGTDVDTFADDLNIFDELGEVGATLVHHLYTVHKSYKRQEKGPEIICSKLVETLRAFTSVIAAIGKYHDQLVAGNRRTAAPLEKDKSDLACAIRATARAFTVVLVGLKKITDSGSERRFPGLVIYECVKMFKGTLAAISDSARLTAATHSIAQTKAAANRGATTPPKDSAASRALAQLLNILMSFLDKNDKCHQQIFDGCLFVLLERIGKQLFYCTFGRHRSPNIEDDIALAPLPTTPAEVSKRETETLAIRLEVRALVLVLERALGLAPNHMNPQPQRSPSRLARTLSLKTLPPKSKARLSQQAKDRLQRTLVSCMFGEEVEDDFLEVLRMPARFGPLPTVAKVEDRDVDDWFKGEVWRLVGWDILGREREL